MNAIKFINTIDMISCVTNLHGIDIINQLALAH